MNISVTEAKAQLTELVRRAEAGEEIVLTRRGVPVARLTPEPRARVRSPEARAAFMARIDQIARQASREALPGPCAARSQDFLYDEDGLPKTVMQVD